MNRQPFKAADVKWHVKLCAGLAYFPFLCIIPLITHRNDSFCLMHAKQGLVLFMGEVSFFLLHTVLGPWVIPLGGIIIGGLSIAGIIAVYKGQFLKLPFVGTMAESIWR